MPKFPENAQFRISENFRKRLKTVMEDNDCVSNEQFAKSINVSVPVISKAVNFGIVPSLRTIIKIADELNLSLKYFLGLCDTNDFIAALSPSSFHIRIKELTEEKEINFGQLAFKMNFPRTYIYEWIKEKTLPSLDYVLDISSYFGVSPDYLLGRTDYKN